MTTTDRLLANNRSYAASFAGTDLSDLTAAPTKHIAILACMDARMDLHRMLGLELGDAHVVRNAGGLATDDAIRSLMLSQRALGTEEVMVIQHTGCGLLGLAEDELKSDIHAETGQVPVFDLGSFDDLDENVRSTVATLKSNPFLRADRVRGFVYDVETGTLREVDDAT